MRRPEYEITLSNEYSCRMSCREAEVREMVALQPEFVGKISFMKDELATQELANLEEDTTNVVVGVTSMIDFRDPELFRLYTSRVKEVLNEDAQHALALDRENKEAAIAQAKILALEEKARLAIVQAERNARVEKKIEARKEKDREARRMLNEEKKRVRMERETLELKAQIDEERARKIRANDEQKIRNQVEKKARMESKRVERIAGREKKWVERQAKIEEGRKRRTKKTVDEYFAEIICMDRTV